jgi:NADH-quinone oxidoreductase subunit M
MFENVLSTMIFLPILAGLVLLLLPISQGAARRIGLLASSIILILGVRLWLDFSGASGMEFSEFRDILPSLGIHYSLGVDGISLFVLLTGAILFPLVFLVMTDQSKGSYGNLLIAQGTMAGAICATDMILFYIFWELMLLPIFFMIGIYGGPKRLTATVKIMIYTVAGSLLMLAAIIYLGVAYHLQFGEWSFAAADLAQLTLQGTAAVLAFTGFMLAFAIKIPLFPLHTWLPDAYTEAPPAATFVLSAIMAKIGVYAVVRYVIPTFETEFARYALLLACSGVIGMIYCGIAAIGQKDIKRLLAFSSASHMGILALGVFCMNLQALTGTIFQIVAHATSTGVLFLFAGVLEERMGTREIDDLGGIARQAPVFAFFFAVALLASVGLPGTSGFIGEFLIILGAVKFNVVIGVLAGTSVIIGVCYMLWMFQRVFFEKSNERTTGFKDLTAVETLAFLPVILLILIMGIYPQPFIAMIEPAAKEQIASLRPAVQVANYTVLEKGQVTQQK